jgi:hypothetical protein
MEWELGPGYGLMVGPDDVLVCVDGLASEAAAWWASRWGQRLGQGFRANSLGTGPLGLELCHLVVCLYLNV